MELLTKEVEKAFEEHPFDSQNGKGFDSEVIVKYFNPVGTGTWLITEAQRQGDDWLLFGYMHLFCWEWGYVTLNQLKKQRLLLGLTIERDLYVREGAKVKDLINQ